jgi:hypothetical protein
VDEVLDLVGLSDVAHARVGGFSLGMRQRLGIAGALLGDPDTIVLDEPVNGLDPEGIRWIRELLRGLATEGRTVFLSSHLMTEMALTAEQLVVVGRGRLIGSMSVAELVASTTSSVRVVTPDAAALRPLLAGPGVTVTTDAQGALDVVGLSAREIGVRAGTHAITLYELAPVQASLEDAFMALTPTPWSTRLHLTPHRPQSYAGRPLMTTSTLDSVPRLDQPCRPTPRPARGPGGRPRRHLRRRCCARVAQAALGAQQHHGAPLSSLLVRWPHLLAIVGVISGNPAPELVTDPTGPPFRDACSPAGHRRLGVLTITAEYAPADPHDADRGAARLSVLAAKAVVVTVATSPPCWPRPCSPSSAARR